MIAQASADGAPRRTRADAARVLGADPERLERALTGGAYDAQDARMEAGLREKPGRARLSVSPVLRGSGTVGLVDLAPCLRHY